MTRGFIHDRMMSLHRRAREVIDRGGDIDEWLGLAGRLEVPSDAQPQIWQTAKTSRDAGMSKELAFPLVAELEAAGLWHDDSE